MMLLLLIRLTFHYGRTRIHKSPHFYLLLFKISTIMLALGSASVGFLAAPTALPMQVGVRCAPQTP